jgi:predicted dehydrogenase
MAAALQRVLMVGHVLQYHPAFQALRGLIAEGRLGRLLPVVFQWDTHKDRIGVVPVRGRERNTGTMPSNLDLEIECGHRPG